MDYSDQEDQGIKLFKNGNHDSLVFTLKNVQTNFADIT
jgi:hypothetical protein